MHERLNARLLIHFISQNHDDGIEQEVDRFFDEEDEEDNEQEGEDEGDRFQEKKQRIAIDIEMPSLPLPVSSDGKVKETRRHQVNDSLSG